ncbi:hypothetical protein [Parasphingorhabdus flavimaris]|uniref:hypothetical protein n=1 Tax=Parasphingorhabdus flavimaris TaxID=266812 RepID=UPI003001AC2E
MVDFREWSYGRKMARVEQQLHCYRYNPDGKKSANVLGADIAANINVSDEKFDRWCAEHHGWLQKCSTGNINNRTGERQRTIPRADRLLRINNFLYENRLMLASDWLPHLGDLKEVAEFVQRNGLRPYADANIMCGRMFFDCLSESITDEQAVFMVLQFIHIHDEPFTRVRRFTLVVERHGLETQLDYNRRIKNLDADYWSMDDQWANVGAAWGSIFEPSIELHPSKISDYGWQFDRKVRILSFTETASNGVSCAFNFVRTPVEIKKAMAVQAKVDDLTR